MNDAWAQAESERVVSNLVRIGTVAELDPVAARVRCAVGGLTTDWLPWLTARAGATRTWSAPRAGEQVLILAPYGDTAQAVALPAIYQDSYPAPASSPDVEQITFPDGSLVAYDSAAHTLTVSAGAGKVIVNCATATVNASTSVKLDTPQTTCTGALLVQGSITGQGGLAISGGSGGASATIAGTMQVTGGDVKADGISLKLHTHREQGDGANTSAAQ